MAITPSSQNVTAGAMGTFGVAMGLGGTDAKYRTGVVLYNLDETILDLTTLMTKTGGSVTALSSGALTNPTSTLTRPASATTASVTSSTTVSPYLTWTGNPLVNGQGIFFTTTFPTGFTQGTTYFVRDVAGNTFNLASTLAGAAIVPGSVGTFGITLEYKTGDLIAAKATGLTTGDVPFFTIPNSAGGCIIPRIRIYSLGTQGVLTWAGAQLSVNFWSAAPTYTGGFGDAQAYLPATGCASWLGNFLVTMSQIGDGAFGSGPLTGGNEMSLKLASGTSVFWDLQILNFMQPFASQTFTLTAECLN